MIPIPPRSKRTDTLFPTTTLSRPLQDGLSARELAIDTTRFGSEKFPMFRAVWLQQPRKDDDSVTVLALLDSASTAGAYRFVIHPGRTTVIDVDTAIFPRTRLDGAGIAPITSMYLHGENDYRRRDDFRQTGRASCRERVCQSVYISVVAIS